MLFKLVCDKSQCQLCRIDRHVDFLQYIRKSTDMILMSVRDHKAFDLGNIFFEVSHIRNDKVDSQHVILWERKSTVHNNNAVAVFKGCDVHSDLFQSAQRNDLESGCTFTSTFAGASALRFILLFVLRFRRCFESSFCRCFG